MSAGRRARANGIELAYDTYGERDDPPILLIMGFAAQRIFWPDDFCRALARRGHFVVRFDNRDVGESSKMDSLGTVDVAAALAAGRLRAGLRPAYTLDDMADDAVGLIDALGFDSAHLCGASMGGMIAQTAAVRHPDRVRSLTSIMSTTGHPELPQAEPRVMDALLAPPPLSEKAYLEHSVKLWRTIGSPGFPFDEAAVRERAALALRRGIHPAGIARQLVAILAHGSRREKLQGLEGVPTLVIHGAEDPLVPPAGGEDTARAIEGAELLLIDGMGHDLPRGAWPQMIERITALVARAERSHRPGS